MMNILLSATLTTRNISRSNVGRQVLMAVSSRHNPARYLSLSHHKRSTKIHRGQPYTREPTHQQLRNLFQTTAIPMIGFGFVDQTLMIFAGNAIDLTLGVTFGLSTLTAAAFGSMISNCAGVIFGSTLDTLFRKMGLPRSGLSSAQRELPVAKRTVYAGNMLGIMLGCSLGLSSLLFVDTDRVTVLKKEMNIRNGHSFHVEASNEPGEDRTRILLRGPDKDGLLAHVTATLSNRGYSVEELHAGKITGSGEHGDEGVEIEDVFLVSLHGKPVPEHALGELVQTLLKVTTELRTESTRYPEEQGDDDSAFASDEVQLQSAVSTAVSL